MKAKTLYWILGIVAALLVIGYFTGLFRKKSNGAVSTGTVRANNVNGNSNGNSFPSVAAFTTGRSCA